jgi:PAS domain S-box-containing protein
MSDAASQTGIPADGPERAGAWIVAGPVAVLAAWLLLVFVPPAFRLQVLYAALLLISVVTFATSFHLSARRSRAPLARERMEVAAQAQPAAEASQDAPGADPQRADAGDERFRLVVEAAPNAMIMIDPRGTIQLLNSQAEKLFGYGRSQLLGQSIEVLLPASLRAMHRAVRGAFMRAPEARRMGAGRDLFGLRSDGVEVPIEIGLNPIATRTGTFVLASIIDITERKRTEQALRASEERFRLVVEDAPNAMIMVDEAGRIALVNAQAERLFGYARAELVGKPVETLVPERHRHGHEGLRRQFLSAPQARNPGPGRDLHGLRRDGTEVPIEIGLNPIRTTEGAFVLASVVDITER